MKQLLVQTQLSNYDTNGKFILECDSGWQMCMGRIREMLKLNKDLKVSIMGPFRHQLMTQPEDINPDLWGNERLAYLEHNIIPNALVTRFDFDWAGLSKLIAGVKYDAVYINDPMHLRNFKALFNVVHKYQPKFFVHSHFIDNPECPKFPTDASLWLGQCEAALRADFNFWQCESSMDVFFESMGHQFRDEAVDSVRAKSLPWDDGYSISEIRSPINEKNITFDTKLVDQWRFSGKKIIFVPNRIGGRGRSSDYTNCGKFMFDILPELRKRRNDFVVIAGNPNQKFFNSELEKECGPNGYMKLTKGAFNRDEYKYIAKRADIAVGLYTNDTFGGTASRECIELGCLPLWVRNYEYAEIAERAEFEAFLAKPDFSDIVDKTCKLLDHYDAFEDLMRLQDIVKKRSSYESTTPIAMRCMGLLEE